MIEALLLNGVVALAVLKLSQPHPEPKEVVTLTPAFGLLLTDMLFASGATPSNS
jgi:hypothetical protein